MGIERNFTDLKTKTMEEKIIQIIRENSIEGSEKEYGSGIFLTIDTLDEIAEEIVKLFSIPDVSQRSEQLCFNCGQEDISNEHTGLCKDCYRHWNKGNNIKTNCG